MDAIDRILKAIQDKEDKDSKFRQEVRDEFSRTNANVELARQAAARIQGEFDRRVPVLERELNKAGQRVGKAISESRQSDHAIKAEVARVEDDMAIKIDKTHQAALQASFAARTALAICTRTDRETALQTPFIVRSEAAAVKASEQRSKPTWASYVILFMNAAAGAWYTYQQLMQHAPNPFGP